MSLHMKKMLVNQNKQKPGHKRENVRLLISFEKAFINQFLRIILSPRYWEYSPIKLGKTFSHWGRYLAEKKHGRKITSSILTPFPELLPNLYYSPIKKLERCASLKLLGNSIHNKSRSKAIAYDFVEKLMRPPTVHFNELNGQPLHINDHIKYEN